MTEITNKIKEISSSEVRAKLADVLAKAYYTDNCFVITKSNKPRGVLIGYKEFQKIIKKSN